MAKTVSWMTASLAADATKQATFPCEKCGASVEVTAPVERDPVKAPCPKCGHKHTLAGKKGGDFG
jgi:predicted RNA-binding Zn-ribbon protein involved in translation (DUF1610 family)